MIRSGWGGDREGEGRREGGRDFGVNECKRESAKKGEEGERSDSWGQDDKWVDGGEEEGWVRVTEVLFQGQ